MRDRAHQLRRRAVGSGRAEDDGRFVNARQSRGLALDQPRASVGEIDRLAFGKDFRPAVNGDTQEIGRHAPIAVVLLRREIAHGRPVGAFDNEFVDQSAELSRERQRVRGRGAGDKLLRRVGDDRSIGSKSDDRAAQRLRPGQNELGQEETPFDFADGARQVRGQ